MSGRGQSTEHRSQSTEPGVPAWVPPAVWLFVAVALLTVPVFAHGCHGDDVDHEPLLIPTRLNPEDR